MADMVLLKCDIGSNAATVLCPECGRISRQILSASYSPSKSTGLFRPHTCPVCNFEFRTCSSIPASNWSAAFARYKRDADVYNQSVKDSYVYKSTSSIAAHTDSSTSIDSAPLISTTRQQIEQNETRAPQKNTAPLQDTSTKPGMSTSAANATSMLEEALDRKIDRWKRDLLDTGKRNKMINFRETSRATLRILEPEASELFNKLAFSEKPLTFQKPINKDTGLRTYSVIALMETLSYNLNVQVGDIKTSGTIIEREKTLKNLRSKAKLAQEEQGTNILYLCFGFIYWKENDRESSPWFKAPLLMMPVTLGMKSLRSPYTLSRYDDEIEVNPTLDYLFNTEYHIDLPTFELKNKQSMDDYFVQIEEIVDKRGWKVAREVSLGLLSFLKISMYHDLNNNRERLVNHPVLRAMAGDHYAIGDLPPQADHFDFDSAKLDEWHEVVDSDSSQEEAILLSKLGVSFVMQGPPGTGKSQTITNIIAEAMADGKKILFVSEKSAALQVVLKRLTDVGLADFCLSLHNYKANKKEIIDSIGANLSLEEEYIDSSALSELTELFHDREFLNAYAKDLHKPIAPLEQSVYMVFGRISKLETATILDFSLDKPTEITKDQYASILYSVSAFEKALHNMGCKLSDNPWHDTKTTTAGQTYKMQLLHDTEELSASLRKIVEVTQRVAVQLEIKQNKSFADAMHLLKIVASLEDVQSYISSTWFDPVIEVQCRETLREAQKRAEQLHQIEETITSEWETSILDTDTQSISEHFCGDLSWLFDSNGNASIEQRLQEYKADAASLRNRLEALLAAYHEGLGIIAYSKEDTAENIRMVRHVLHLIAEAPYMEASWFDKRKNDEIVPLIEEALSHSAVIATLTEEILKEWEPTALELDAEAMLGRFKTDYVGMLHTLKSGYKNDVRMLRLHSKAVGGKINEATVIDFLQKVKELNTEKSWFEAHYDELSFAMGNQYRGESTEWSRVRESMAKALEITAEFPYSSIPNETVAALIAITESMQVSGQVRRLEESLSEDVLIALETDLQTKRYVEGYSGESNLSIDIVPQIDSFIKTCDSQSQYVSVFVSAKKNGSLAYRDITTLLSNISTFNDAQEWFAQHQGKLRQLFAGAYRDEHSDWSAITLGLNAAKAITNIFDGDVPDSIIRIACGQKELPDAFGATVEELFHLLESTEPKIRAFSAQFKADDFLSLDMDAVAARYDSCLADFMELNKWLDYAETREECDKHGLAAFTAKIAESDNTVRDVQAAFELGFYTQWLNHQLDKVPAVQSFRRRLHEQYEERFVALDSKQCIIARKRIHNSIISTYPDLNRVARAGSEVGILRHEMGKKQRIMPLRKLFKSIPTLLLTLKPCLMMSPLSVAYFLDADSYQFDMVIFDEASQIFPQDAIGAIFRAKQVIIAGDTKQLPPTNFFSSSTSNSSDGYDNDEGYEEEVYDSILEETANVLPNRTLLWHYRSKHEHLIAFSNQEIYKNELVTFPSSNESEPDTGVEFIYVEDGYYEPSPKNYNVLETRRIVELVKEHIEKYPNRSLGIIAFSEKQQQAISREIQRFREKHSEYEAFFAEGKEDEFFVKNLENVQGDERDTIFFSIGYAKTKDQKTNGRPMSMRFGPLGVAGGERRLNVAITRAKINIKLVGSILPSDIDLSRTESEGIRMLRSYIEFAMNGDATLAAAHESGRPDEFADSIAEFIRKQGFEVQQYVGCSGYKIDIAVKHPSDLVEQFVAGIECDGFSYASARTARDRNRLRNTVLKNMGWNLYRVWSAEWYKNPEVEGQKLVDFLRKAISTCDERIKKLEEQRRQEEEAKRLELEMAKTKREVEERKARIEQEKKEETLRAEREAAERRRQEEFAKKAAKVKAEPEAVAKREEERRKAVRDQQSLLETLKGEGFRFIDNRAASSILWVFYDPVKKAAFERIILGYSVQWRLEKRGALATGNAPAWRIMFN